MSEDVRYTVAAHEHVGTVAARHGVRDPHWLWNHAANAELKTLRVNPFTLLPGDVITIPVLEPLEAQRATGQTHRFTLEPLDGLLTLKLLDADANPLKNRKAVVRTGTSARPLDPETTRIHEGTTDGDGKITAIVSDFATDGELTLAPADAQEGDDVPPEHRLRLLVTVLPPVNSIAGQRMRLNNLGYFAGYNDRNLRQLRWAIEEFEFDHKLKVTGKSDNPTFFNKLGHVHGDLLPGEKLDLPLVQEPASS